MKAHDLAKWLLAGPDLEVRHVNEPEPCDDSTIVKHAEVQGATIWDKCKNCLAECPADRFSHTGADGSGPCTRLGCNPMCKGFEPKYEQVVVIS